MQRLIEMIIPGGKWDEAEELLEEDDKVFEFWYEEIAESKIVVKLLVDAEKSQTIIDKLKDNFDHYKVFRLLLFHVEASLPVDSEEKAEKEEEGQKEKEEGKETKGVSREEIYAEVKDKSELSRVYLLLIVLSSIVASIGILRQDVAVIVGAMVIAPMLSPNVGLSLATTLADSELAKKAAKSAVIGIVLSFVVAVVLGIVLTVDPSTSEIATRTEIGLLQVVLALSAGSAGALAYTRGLSSAVIGVMVSLALVPALAASGLLIGSTYFILGFNAMVLFFINLICVNLSGVLTFLAQGFQPRAWWEADKAKSYTRKALIIWMSLLAVLIVGIIYTRYFG